MPWVCPRYGLRSAGDSPQKFYISLETASGCFEAVEDCPFVGRLVHFDVGSQDLAGAESPTPTRWDAYSSEPSLALSR